MRNGFLGIAGAMVLGACASTQPVGMGMGMSVLGGHGHAHASPGADGEMMEMQDAAVACPLAVQGTTATAEDTAEGVAIAFTTRGDVAELRRRVVGLVARNGGEGLGRPEHSRGCWGAAGRPVGGVIAESEDLPDGARFVLVPMDLADLPSLRESVHRHVARMAAEGCPMIGAHHTAGTPAGGEPHASRQAARDLWWLDLLRLHL